jgi:hypothetical protein
MAGTTVPVGEHGLDAERVLARHAERTTRFAAGVGW